MKLWVSKEYHHASDGELGDPLLEEEGNGDNSRVPTEISKQGRAAISAYNAAISGGKQRLNWAKLIKVFKVCGGTLGIEVPAPSCARLDAALHT